MFDEKRRKWIKPAIIIAVLVLLGALIAVRVASKKVNNAATQVRPQPVTVTKVVSCPFGEELSVAGTVSAFTEAKLAPKVAGRVVSLNAGLGQKVSRGQVLLTIDQSDYQTALRVAEANLSAAEANTINVETSYENAKVNYERTEELFKQGAVSKSQLEQAKGLYAAAESGYQANQAQISQCEAALDKARTDLDNTVLKAPFDGVVDQRLTDIGELVSQQTPVLTLIQDRPLLVKVNMAESTVTQVALQQKVKVFVAATGKSYQGTVTAVAPQADQATRAFPVEITLDNPGEEIKPGMVADLRLTTKRVDKALVVPTDSVLSEDSGMGVFVLDNNVARHRKVVTGMVEQGYTQIVSGLSEGEMVVVKGNHLLVDGMGVKVEEIQANYPAQPGGEAR